MVETAMRGAIVVSLLLAALLGSATAGEPSWYHCSCEGRANCACPSRTHPASDRIPIKDVPQFILFTHDDAIMSNTDQYMREVCDGHYNPNGCPVRATMFTMVRNTDCGLAWQMWKDGYEIADHTVTHQAMDSSMEKEKVEYEITGMRSWIAAECGVPEADVRGFRCPYLTTAPATRQVLHEKGFLYDSTLIEGKGYSLSYGMGERVWPYTMDHGIPQNCAFYSPGQTCEPQEEKYPGLWQVPMWTMSASSREYTMDYGHDNAAPLYDILRANFEATYAGNKAPLPLYIHTPWFSESRTRDLQKFRDYTLSKGDVYWVTITQLLEWMQHPVPASQLRLSGALCGMAPSPPPPAPSPPPPMPMPNAGINITFVFEGNEASVAEHHSCLIDALAELLGPAAPSAIFIKDLRFTADPVAPAPAAAPAAPPPSLATQHAPNIFDAIAAAEQAEPEVHSDAEAADHEWQQSQDEIEHEEAQWVQELARREQEKAEEQRRKEAQKAQEEKIAAKETAARKAAEDAARKAAALQLFQQAAAQGKPKGVAAKSADRGEARVNGGKRALQGAVSERPAFGALPADAAMQGFLGFEAEAGPLDEAGLDLPIRPSSVAAASLGGGEVVAPPPAEGKVEAAGLPMPGDRLEITIVAAGSDPLAIAAALADDMAALNLTLAAEPVVVPFRDGKVVALPPPPAPTASAAPLPPQETTGSSSGTTAGGSSGSSAIPLGVWVGIGAGSAVVLAAIAVAAVLGVRRSRHAASKAAQPAAHSSGRGGKEEGDHTAIQLGASTPR